MDVSIVVSESLLKTRLHLSAWTYQQVLFYFIGEDL